MMRQLTEFLRKSNDNAYPVTELLAAAIERIVMVLRSHHYTVTMATIFA